MTGCNYTQILLATGKVLFYLDVTDGKLVLAGDATMEYEIACIDVTPLNEAPVEGDSSEDSSSGKSDIVAIGLWTDITVRLLKLPNLEEITKEALGGGKVLNVKVILAEKGYLVLLLFPYSRNDSPFHFDGAV